MRDLKKLYNYKKQLQEMQNSLDAKLYPDLSKKLMEAEVHLQQTIAVLEHNNPLNFKRIIQGLWH